jgi:CHAT domain-containing protein/TPR repeat protein
MDEERRKAYLNLIDTLLRCPSGEEPQILNANSDFVDAGLVQTMEKVAEVLRDRGDRNAANFLINIARQLAEALELLGNVIHRAIGRDKVSSTVTPEEYFDFLVKVLNATEDSNGNPQVVYSLLKANLDKLDYKFATLLGNSAIAYLFTEPEQAQRMAAVICNLSKFIKEFPLGNRASNLEIAIKGYRVVARVFTSKAFPEDWAKLQTNLGNAYLRRILGERAENLETAIDCYFAALEIYTSKALLEDWAMILNNLGIAYLDRIRGERGHNLEQAVECHLAASGIYTRKAFPQEWATTQNLLGSAYLYRIRGDTEKNLEAAIRSYRAALKVLTPEGFPQDWADTQNNLGEAYRHRIRWQRVNNLEAAIRCYRAALEIRTREAFPEDWADTQNNLGNAYLDRIRGKKKKNLEAAIACYKAALEFRTCKAFPQKHIETLFNLGLAYNNGRQFRDAYDAFAAAIDTLESLRGEIVSGYGREEDKQKLAEKWNQLYQGMVKVCLTLGNTTEAIEYAERSKTRNLVELILTRDLYSIFPPEIVNQLEQLRDEISSGQYQLQSATADNPTALAQHLQQLRQQRNELQDRNLPIGYGFNFEKFQETLDDYTAIIQWYITSTGFETFIITRYSLQQLILPTLANDLKALVDWANEYLDAYTQAKTQWINSLASRLSRLAEILHLEDIVKLVPDTCSRLILIPHRFLHLFPLHALPLANGDFLCDRFPKGVGYAPSCQLLQLTQKRERPDFSNFFAIQNPTDDLLYTNLEVETIRSSFPSAQVLVKQAATKTALKTSKDLPLANCNHFSCHGEFNLTSPLESALLLANKECLTLGEIFGLNLNQCRLVTLSACETGLTDPTSISDEYIGLPSGFLYAGSPSVVSSLWTVSDLSTAFLMIKFYENFSQCSQQEAGAVAVALNQAQKWLRNLTIEEGEAFLDKLKPQIEEIFKGKPRSAKAFLNGCQNRINNFGSHPFANPFDWAAFTATGL